jgi:hypothetical protein
MASGYDLKYVPPKKGDEWKPETLVGSLEKIQKLGKLNPNSGKDLETIMGEFMGPELGNFGAEQRGAVLNSYANSVNSSIGDYVLGNVKDVVDYVGKQKVLPLAAKLPYSARKAAEGATLSESDVKYNAIVSAGDSFKKIIEAVKTEEGAKKELEAEFAGTSDFAKQVWLRALGPQAFLQYRVEKAQNKLLKAIDDYGVAAYIKDAVAISDKAEKEFNDKKKSIMEKQKSELEEKLSAGTVTPMDEAKLNDKYAAEIAEVQKKYAGLQDARQFVLIGAEETQGLLGLVASKYDFEKKKAEAEKKKKEAEAKAKEIAGDKK